MLKPTPAPAEGLPAASSTPSKGKLGAEEEVTQYNLTQGPREHNSYNLLHNAYLHCGCAGARVLLT